MKKSIWVILILGIAASVVLLNKANTTDVLPTKISLEEQVESIPTEPAIEIQTESAISTEEAIEISTEKESSENNQEKEVKKPVKKEAPKEEPVVTPTTEPALEVVERVEEKKINKTAKRVEYIQSKNKNISLEDATTLVELFERFAEERDYIDTELLMGIARLESGYIADCGEKYIGLMQVSAKYGELAGYTLEQLKDPYYNLEYAMAILDDLNVKCGGNIKYILQSYNMGYYAFKNKLDSGEELSYSFYNVCKRYADQIIDLYDN